MSGFGELKAQLEKIIFKCCCPAAVTLYLKPFSSLTEQSKMCYHIPRGGIWRDEMGNVHEHTKKVVDRLSRAIGHMEAVKRMVQEKRDCNEVLIQIAAIRSAVNNIGKLVLQDHIDHCIIHAVKTGDQDAVTNLREAIDKFMK